MQSLSVERDCHTSSQGARGRIALGTAGYPTPRVDRRRRSIGIVVVLCGLLATVTPWRRAGEASAGGRGVLEVSWYSLDGGGGQSSGGPFDVSGTIGQVDAGQMVGGGFRVSGGIRPVQRDMRGPGDCNGNGVPDATDITLGTSSDCNLDDLPDECSLADSAEADCNNDDIPDDCQIMQFYTGSAAPPDEWAQLSNWLGQVSPSDGDHACIRCNDRTPSIVFAEDYRLLASMASELDLTIDGNGGSPELELDGPSFVKGDLEMTGSSTLRNNSDLLVRGTLHWVDGTIRGPGTTTVTDGLTLTPADDRADLRDGHHLRLVGGSAAVNSKLLALSNASTFTIGNGVTYTYHGSASVFSGGSGRVAVEGTFVRATGDDRATISSMIDATGLIHNMSGELQLRGGGTHSGMVLSGPGTTLWLRDTHDFLPSSSLTAERLVFDAASGTSYVRGAIDIAASLECIGSTWVITDEADIINLGDSVFVVQGTLELDGPTDRALSVEHITVGPSPPATPSSNAVFDSGQPIETEVFGFYNGAVRGSSPINIHDEFVWDDGSFFAGGDVTAYGSIDIQDTNHSRGTHRGLRVGGNATMRAGLTLNNGGRLDILSTGMFELLGDTSITGTVINNAGVLVKTTVNDESRFTADINNTGTVELLTGTIHLQQMDYLQTAGQTVLNGGSITSYLFDGLQIEGGLLAGVGSADCDVYIDGGTMAPGLGIGELFVGGDYFQSSVGKLAIEIAGPDPDGSDVLSVGGVATLSGTLDVALIDGYVPAVGSTFEILTATMVESEFASVALVGFPAHLDVIPMYGATTVTLEVVMRAAADCDENGAIDLIDAACFVACMQGPAAGVAQDCGPFDLDGNGSVDLADYGRFSALFESN